MNTKDLINQIEISGIITRAQLYTIIRRANSGDKDAKSVCFKENTCYRFCSCIRFWLRANLIWAYEKQIKAKYNIKF